MLTTKSDQAFYQEERVILVIQIFKSDQISIVQAAAKLYNVSHNNLIYHLHDCTARVNTSLKNQKLSLTEKESLIQ